MLNRYDDEERKKREKEFEEMFGNNRNITASNEYIKRANEFDKVYGNNNINYEQRANDFDTLFGNKLQDKNTLKNNSSNVSNNSSIDKKLSVSTEEKDYKKKEQIKKKIDEQIKNTSTAKQGVTQNANALSESKNKANNAINQMSNSNISLAKKVETENATEVSQKDVQARLEAEKKNENIEKGGVEAFNEWADTTLNNISSGFEKAAAGLANVVTTISGLGIRGFEGLTSLLGFNDTSDKLNELYNKVVDTGSDIKETADYESNVTSQINNDFIRTSGEVADVVSNMAGNAMIGYAIGVEGTIIQGLSVAGSSAQEVLNKNKNNIIPATVTGIAKGYVSYLTEKMFDANILTRGQGTSISDAVNKVIARKITSNFGKEFANKTIGIIGENIEELAEDNIGYLIDKLVNNEDLPNFKQWLNSTSETAKITTLSTIMMSMLGMGGTSFKEIENDMEAQYWVNEAQKIIDNEDMAIHFNPGNAKNLNDVQEFYVTDFDENGEISGIYATKGKEISNPNTSLNVTPVIIRDNNSNFYNVIDGNTGVLLDSTYYETTLGAEQGFNEKVNKLTELQVKDINKKINEADYLITNKIIDTINQAKQQINKQNFKNETTNVTSQNSTQINEPNQAIEQNISESQEINNTENKNAQNGNMEQIDNVLKSINQIQDNTVYSDKQVYDIAKFVSKNIDNVHIIEQSGERYINSLNKDGYVVYQQKLDKTKYKGREIKDFINNAIQNADLPNKSNTTSTTQTSSEANISNFNSNTSNYAVDNIKKVTEAFESKNEYTKNELAEIWNNINKNNYDASYDNNGNIQSYIAIEEYGDNLVVNQYDNKDNVVKSEIIPKNNGKYTSEDVRSTIEKVASIYDENKPIKGQVDVENNETKNIQEKQNKETKIDKKIKEYLKNNTNFEFEIDIDTTELKDIDIKNIKQMEAYKYARDLFKEIHKRKFKNKLDDIFVTNTDIKESVNLIYTYTNQRKLLKENLSIYSYLDRVIEKGIEISNENELKGRNNYQNWKYYVTPIKIDNKKYLVEFDTVKREDGETHFRVERLYPINSKGDSTTVVPTEMSATRFTVESPSINNSIPQNTENVKSENTVTNKDMQNNEKNTNIQDFGEKIGGARKDLSQQRTTKTDKEVIHDYTVKDTENGYSVNFKGKVLKDGFNTQVEAEQYILDFKENIKNNMAFVKEYSDSKYLIYIKNSRTLKSQYAGKEFSNKQDAEAYAMALSMYLKENGKNLSRPQIQEVTRVNSDNNNSTKTTGNDILKDFGFKGGEFGNWVKQSERQKFLNYAQDAFTDLATALEILPSDLGQNGEMNIAFGARGNGITGAVAHFEPSKKVINMTRLKGAGSLAHEYGHSIDNWLSRLSGYNDDGMATTNIRNTNLSDNMKKAINDVKDAIQYNISTNQEEINKKNAIYEKNRKENLEYNLKYIDKVFSGEATTYKYNRKTKQREQVPIEVTTEQSNKYKNIKDILVNGQLKGQIEYKINSSTLNTEKIYPEPIDTLQKLYKEVVGRKLDDDTVYALYRQGKPTKQISEVKSESAYSKSAMELDKATGRATAYFSKIEEMWARAFESYVSDKLKAKGIIDTYLVHSVNNDEYALFNPFPAGEERKNINKAFDKLIQTMKDEGILHDNKTKISNDSKKQEQGNDIRYMKKSNSKSTNTQKVTDNQGRELSKQQQEYFRDSKVRDENGNLLVMYHGTEANVGIPKEFWFTVFDIDKAGNHGSMLGNGFYFTSNKNHAEQYSHLKGNIYETYLNIKKPLEVTNFNKRELAYSIKNTNPYIEADIYKNDGTIDGYKVRKYLLDNGYDGIHSGDTYVAFNSNQIKNIDNTNPTSNEDIRFAKKSATSQNQNIDKTKRNAERTDAYIEQEIKKIEETGNWDNSIPVTSLTDIRKTIEDYLGLGIKKGHFREDVYAIYKGNRDVIRTKEFKDIDSILHETGHALDLGNRLKLDKEKIADELFTAIDKLGGYEEEKRTVRLEEGFAEVIREYSIIPKQAKMDYPQSVAVIEEIRQNDKKFDKFITKVQQQTYNYIHQNPQKRLHSNQSIGKQTDKAPFTKAWVEQEVMRNIWDKDYAVKKAVNELAKVNSKTVNQIKASNNAYDLLRLSSGISDKVTSMLADGYIDEKGKKLMPGLNNIGEILGDNPQRYNDLRDYLVARRDTDYKSKTLKTGIRDMDTKFVLDKFKNDTQIQEAAKVIYDTLDGVMQYAVNNGLITEEDVKKLKESNAFYVPMQRVIEGKGNQTGRRGAVADIIKKRTGSELDIKDVLENIVSNSSNIIQQVENNNILKALYNQGEEIGLTGAIYDVIPVPMTKIGTTNLNMWETELKKQGVDTSKLDLEKTIDLFAPNKKVDSQNLITSFINDDGKRVYLQFKDEILFNSLMNMDKKFMSQVLKINSKLNMPLRYGATMANIGFSLPNMISDTAQATIFSNAGFIPVVDNALGVLDVLTATNKHVRNFVNKYSPEYVQRIENMYNIYKQTGATTSTRLSQYRDSTQNVMKDIYGTKNSETLGINEKYKPLKRLLDILIYIPEISEQSTRFRVFERNYDYYKNKGNSEMDTRILAALESRDATQDFGRTGNLTKEINQLIPFSAARVGSAYTFAEKIAANPKQVGMRIAVLTAIAMAIKSIGYDDKEIEELNQRKKDDNFVLKIGDNVITIKKPQGILRSMINLAEYIQDLATGHIEDGKEAERLGEWVNNAIMDNMPADSVTGLVPNMVAPLIENAINKDFYYNTDIVKSYDLDLPDSEQYYDYNSQLAILLGKAFNYSPAKIDNLISGYFAGLGTQVTSIMDYISGKLGITAEKPEMGAESNSVGKRFVVNVNSNSSSIDEIYDRKTELTKKKNGGTITSEEETELATITDAVSNMSKVNKQIKEIKADLTMSGKEKAEKIKILQQQRTDIARQALGKDLIYNENVDTIETISFYPTNSTLSLNNYKLELTSEMKKEYATLASEFYQKYEKQGIYSEDKLKEIKTKAKEYAKKSLMQKYRNQLVKSK